MGWLKRCMAARCCQVHQPATTRGSRQSSYSNDRKRPPCTRRRRPGFDPGTAIALAGGTTTFALAQCLLDVPGLTIVTNSLRVTNLFNGTHGLDSAADSVVLTGGVRTPSDPGRPGRRPDHPFAAFRPAVPRLLRHRRRCGLTTPNLAEAETNRTLMRVARRVVVLADHTKWGLVSLSSFAGLSDIDVLVTDDMLSAEGSRGRRRSGGRGRRRRRHQHPQARPALSDRYSVGRYRQSRPTRCKSRCPYARRAGTARARSTIFVRKYKPPAKTSHTPAG